MLARTSPIHKTPAARGFSLVEVTFVLTLLAGAFLAILSVLNFIGSGMYFESAAAEQTARTTGTLYDIVAEIRDATAYSPNFYIEVNPVMPPSMVFDKVDSIDAEGNVVWGSKIRYRLEKATDPASLQFQSDHPGVVCGRILRDEWVNPKDPQPQTWVVEERVPYQFMRNGSMTWGFNIVRNGCALTVCSSRFGDMKMNLGAPVDDAGSPQKQTPVAPLSNVSMGSIIISTATGTYYLKNPKVVIPAE